jgi:hypothetical protein
MRRFAKILCGFGSIEILCAFIALFIFEHVPALWGSPGGLGEASLLGETSIDKTTNWQAHVFISMFSAAVIGATFLLVGCVIYLISKLVFMAKSGHKPQ